MSYEYQSKETGDVFTIPATQEKRFFDVIEDMTGLDAPVARAILKTRPIDHPKYQFRESPALSDSPTSQRQNKGQTKRKRRVSGSPAR